MHETDPFDSYFLIAPSRLLPPVQNQAKVVVPLSVLGLFVVFLGSGWDWFLAVLFWCSRIELPIVRKKKQRILLKQTGEWKETTTWRASSRGYVSSAGASRGTEKYSGMRLLNWGMNWSVILSSNFPSWLVRAMFISLLVRFYFFNRLLCVIPAQVQSRFA